MPDAACPVFLAPGTPVEARRRTSAGLHWHRGIVAARAPFGYVTRFPDGAEFPRAPSDVRPVDAPARCPRPLPAIGARVLFAPYGHRPDPSRTIEYDERAKLVEIDGDTVTVIIGCNSVRQYDAARSNPDGVRRVSVPLRCVLPDVPVIGRRVLVSDHAMFNPRYVPATIIEDQGNTVTVQEDARPFYAGRHIVGLRYVFTPHGRPLVAAMADEARGATAWETDFAPDLYPETRRYLEAFARRYDALEATTEAEAVRAMLAFPDLDLLLSPTPVVNRLQDDLRRREMPVVDLSVKGLNATVTARRREGVWGVQWKFSYRCGSYLSVSPARDSFSGSFPTAEAALQDGVRALARHAAPQGVEFSAKTQQAAFRRFTKRVTEVLATYGG